MNNNQELYGTACGLMPGGVSHELRYRKPYPLYISRAEGPLKWDVEGQQYIDYKMGSASQLLGHAHKDIVEAVSQQMQRVAFSSDCHEAEIEWAKILVDLYPSADMVRFTASGTEATMLAVRLGRAHSAQSKVLRIEGHYHGWHDLLLKGAKPGLNQAPSLGVPCAIEDLTIVAPAHMDIIKEILEHDEAIGTVIVEASGANYGCVPLPDNFLANIRQLTREMGKILVFDEIITGFRWAPGGRQARDGVIPDLTCLAKILTGGLPGGAVVGRRGIMCLLDPGENRNGISPPVSHKGTFNASPVVAAGALAAMNHIATGQPQLIADTMARRLRRGLREILGRRQISGAVYGESSTFHIYLGPCEKNDMGEGTVKGLSPAIIRGVSGRIIQGLRHGLLERGVDLMSHMSGVLSSAHEPFHIDQTLEIFDDTLKELLHRGILGDGERL